MEKFNPFTLDPKKIDTGERGKQFTEATIHHILTNLKEKKTI